MCVHITRLSAHLPGPRDILDEHQAQWPKRMGGRRNAILLVAQLAVRSHQREGSLGGDEWTATETVTCHGP